METIGKKIVAVLKITIKVVCTVAQVIKKFKREKDEETPNRKIK